MIGNPRQDWWDKVVAEPDEQEAFARMLYTAFGGFVDWELLPEPSRSKEEYRAKAGELLGFLHSYRERHGIVPAPLEPTPAMLEAGYRAMLAAREKA